MSAFNPKQTLQLLAPIRKERVLRDGKGHSHVSQQDITAHLIRVFGFGAFDTEILKAELVYEQERTNDKGEFTNRWDVCYRALLRLTIRDEHGNEVCHYEDGSTATAQNQSRSDAHDLAYKSALSLAKKRAAINLGDQFGLSLYNKGQMSALVMDTLVKPESEDAEHQDMQEGVEQQVSLGNDEVDHEPAPDPAIEELNAAKAEVKAAWEATRGEWITAEAELAYDSDFDKKLGDATAAELRAWAQDLRAHASAEQAVKEGLG